MNLKMEAMRIELESCKNVCEMYLEKEEQYKNQIKIMQNDYKLLQFKLEIETEKLKNEIEQLKNKGFQDNLLNKDRNEKFQEIVEFEIKCLQQIAASSMNDRQSLVNQIKHLKGILLIPRLYHIYK